MRFSIVFVWTLLVLSLTAECGLAAPIHDAAAKDQVSKVAAILKKNPKLLNAQDKDQATPLHYAVASGKTGVVKLLLGKNALVNLKRKDGATPLHIAFAMGRNDIIELLDKKGAKAELSNVVVVFPKGAIIMRNGKKLSSVQKGSVIKVYDVISGGSKGNLDLIVGSVAAVRVKPATRIRIQQAEKTKTGVDIRIRLGKGTTLTRLRKLIGQSRFIMETPGAVAAARGTAFLTRYWNNRTDVMVAEGRVAVSLAKTPTQEVEVGASQKVEVTKELPAAPTDVTASDAGMVNELLSVKQPSVREPKSGEVSINPIDGAEMVWVPAGEFLMGSSDAQIAELLIIYPYPDYLEGERPQRRIYLDGFWIYKYEVTVAQYRQFCLETNTAMPAAPEWGWVDSHPIGRVNWREANAYSNWAGAYLPTSAQWEKAARGNDGRVYPWGNEWDASKCNESTRGPGRTQPVGSYPTGASPYGCMDMAGNVWEWCSDWYAADYYKNAPSRNPGGPMSGDMRMMPGGSYHRSDCFEDYRCSKRGTSVPTNRSSNIGFRCARSQ